MPAGKIRFKNVNVVLGVKGVDAEETKVSSSVHWLAVGDANVE